MQEVSEKYPDLVQVEFINITSERGKLLSQDFGIFSIPCQVLIDKNGNEFFRHLGYIPFKKLDSKIKEKLNQNE